MIGGLFFVNSNLSGKYFDPNRVDVVSTEPGEQGRDILSFCLLICRIRNFIAMASSTSRAKKVWRKRKILPKKEPIGDNFGLSRKSPRCAQCLKFNADDPSKVGDDEHRE